MNYDVIRRLANTEDTDYSYWFYCPGCEQNHPIRVVSSNGLPVWKFNGDLVKPTFSPSLLVWGSRPEKRCHSFIRDGQIQFLNDCHHSLAGMTVKINPFKWDDD